MGNSNLIRRLYNFPNYLFCSNDSVISYTQLNSLYHYLRTSISVPLMLIYFLMLMINTLLRDTKDTLLVTLSANGVKSIPILKTWFVIPCSMLYFVVYSKLNSRIDQKSLFLLVLTVFSLFYSIFSFLFIPSLNNYQSEIKAENNYGHFGNIKILVWNLLQDWPLGLFFIVSEMWASGVCQLLFWQVANDCMSLNDAKKIYPAIGAMGNLGMVVAGHLLLKFADQRDLLVAARAYLRISEEKRIAKNVKSNFGHRKLPRNLIQSEGLPLKEIKHSALAKHNQSNVEKAFRFLQNNNQFVEDPIIQGWRDTLQGTAFVVVICSTMMVFLYRMLLKRRSLQERLNSPHSRTSLSRGSSRNGNELISRNGSKRLHSHSSSGSDLETRRLLSEKYNHESPSSRKANEKFPHEKNKLIKPKVKTSLRSSLKTLLGNDMLRVCAMLVVSYGISSCLVEVSWKAEVKHAFQSPNQYSRFMAKFWFWTGIMSMLFMVTGRCILPIESYGFKIAVLFTPLVEIFAGSIFFLASIMQHTVEYQDNEFSTFSAYAGALLVMTAKSAKYAFFDTTKEMIFISLDPEAKSIGKAAIELIAYRLAKSGGSFYLQLVIMFTGSINFASSLALIAILFFFICFMWTKAACMASSVIKNRE